MTVSCEDVTGLPQCQLLQPTMGDRQPSCLLVCVLLVALLGLGLAGLGLGWRLYDELLGGEALRDRLDHLEQVGG